MELETGVDFRGLQPFQRSGDVTVGHGQVGGQDAADIDGEIVPVNDTFPVTSSFLLHLLRIDGVAHPENEILYLHASGTEQVSPGIRVVRIIGILQGQHTVEVHDFPSRCLVAGLITQVEHAAAQLKAPDIGSAAAEKAPERKLGRKVAYIDDRIHSTDIGPWILEQEVFHHQGVKGPHGEEGNADVGRETLLQLFGGLPGQECLHLRRLDGDKAGQKEQDQKADKPDQYFEEASH